ncbi:MAG: ABC transporter permease [Candidatus Eisenbacteria bacterium]
MDKVLALALKDLRLLLRDKAGFFFTFFFPLIIAVFFGTIFSGEGGGSAIPVLVVDEDGSSESQAFVRTLGSAPELSVRLTSRQDAVETVRRGKTTAYVVLTPGFGDATKQMFWGSPPRVELGVDPARRAEAGMIEGILMKYASKRFQDFFSNPEAQRRNMAGARDALNKAPSMPQSERQNLEQLFASLERFYAGLPESSDAPDSSRQRGVSNIQPIEVQKVDVTVHRAGPKNAYAITFPQGIIWGFIGVTAAFGISIVTERTKGTLLRLQVAPIGRAHILAGKALACFIMAVALSTGLLALAFFAFGVRPTSFPMLALAVISSALSFVGLMMLLSVLGRTEEAASGIGWAVLLVFSMLGGGMIPYFFMPGWMRGVSNFSPVKWAVLAMEGAIWRQFSLTEMLFPCGILIGVGAIFFAAGVRAFTWTSEQ